MDWNEFISSKTVGILELIAPVSSCIFGILATANDTKKEVVKKITINGNSEEVKAKVLNKWGKVSLAGLIVSMLFSVSTKSIKIISDDRANKEKQERERLAALDAIEKYNNSIRLQMQLKDSSRIILDSMKQSLTTQRILVTANKDIQGRTSNILNLQDQSLLQQQLINLNTKRILAPLFPMEIAVDFHIHFNDLTSDQRGALLEIRKKIEEAMINPEFVNYADKQKTRVSSFSVANIFSGDSSNKYYILKDQFEYFEPAMILNFRNNSGKNNGRPSVMVIRFSRVVNSDVIPHKSFATFNFMDSIVSIELSLNQIENATNNDNYASLYDLRNVELYIRPFLGRRFNPKMNIAQFRMSTGYRSFKNVYFRLKPEEKTTEGYVHVITSQELGIE